MTMYFETRAVVFVIDTLEKGGCNSVKAYLARMKRSSRDLYSARVENTYDKYNIHYIANNT